MVSKFMGIWGGGLWNEESFFCQTQLPKQNYRRKIGAGGIQKPRYFRGKKKAEFCL